MIDWYAFWTGGPLRNAVYGTLKPLVAPDVSRRIAAMERLEEQIRREIEPYQAMPMGRLREASMGFVPPHIIAPHRNEEARGYQPTHQPRYDGPPQGGSVIALPDGRITMHEAADALTQAFGAGNQESEPYTPQADYEGVIISIEGYSVTLPPEREARSCPMYH